MVNNYCSVSCRDDTGGFIFYSMKIITTIFTCIMLFLITFGCVFMLISAIIQYIKKKNMFGIPKSNRIITGKFAVKVREELQKMMELKKSGTFRNKDHKPKHNIIWKDES